MWCIPIFSHLHGNSSITPRVRKRFLHISNSDQMGKKKKKKKPFPFVCLADSNSQQLGMAKQMTEKHHPAGAVTPQPLLGLAAFLPRFPGSQNVLELFPRGFGAGKLISAQPSTVFAHQTDAQVNKPAHKSTLLLEFFGNRAPTKSRIQSCAALSSRGDALLPSDKVRGCPKTTLPAP